ncbi:MAG: hypothetical protein J5449_03535 [Oscillospiraceae bacterium]|nr:hypothetical protein [Oscillospiraceae bacterium]
MSKANRILKIILLIFIFVLIIALFVWNLLAAGERDRFTAISGWVGFLATASIGALTLWQAKTYSIANDKVLKEQQIILESIRETNALQNENLMRNHYYEAFESYSNKLQKYYHLFCEYNYSWANMEALKIVSSKLDAQFIAVESSNYNRIALELSDFLIFLTNDYYCFQGKYDLLKAADRYSALLKDYLTKELFNNLSSNNGNTDEFSERDHLLEQSYLALQEQFLQYSTQVKIYSSSIIDGTAKVSSVCQDVKSMREKQLNWLKERTEKSS